MKADLVITGLPELYAALRMLPESMTGDAAGILTTHAEAAATEIRDAYPEASKPLRRMGNLKRGVRTDKVDITAFGASIRVISSAPHAHLYELGTARGGRPHPTFVPVIQRTRQQILAAQIALVRRQGFAIGGSFAI